MRPVVEGMCSFESIKSCLIDLEDLAKMNDAIDVRNENQARYRKAQEA